MREAEYLDTCTIKWNINVHCYGTDMQCSVQFDNLSIRQTAFCGHCVQLPRKYM
jgi:hypothetical protein